MDDSRGVTENTALLERTSDRIVYAFGESAEVVRYELAGKWFIEFKVPYMPCQEVRLDEAIRKSLWLWYEDNGSINFGRPGGALFDRRVRSVVLNHPTVPESGTPDKTFMDNPPAIGTPPDSPWGYLTCGCRNNGYGHHVE